MVLDRGEGRETLRSCVNAAGAVFSVDGAPRLQIKCEGVKKMKNTLIVAGLAVAGLMGAANMEGPTAENHSPLDPVFLLLVSKKKPARHAIPIELRLYTALLAD